MADDQNDGRVPIQCRRHRLFGRYPIEFAEAHLEEHAREEAEARDRDMQRKQDAEERKAIRARNEARRNKKNSNKQESAKLKTPVNKKK